MRVYFNTYYPLCKFKFIQLTKFTKKLIINAVKSYYREEKIC